ncbi:MAG: hypothetical protein RI560_03695, partial [Natronomonas sp.]|nr:hypothetical protein [Natronomonas sp.]
MTSGDRAKRDPRNGERGAKRLASSEDERSESSKMRAGGAERRLASSEDERSESSRMRAGGAERRHVSSENDRSELRTDGGTADEIPLNIAGHDAEKKRREATEEADDDGILSEFDVSDPRESAGDEVEPVELLVQLADDGEIDPWDIDV